MRSLLILLFLIAVSRIAFAQDQVKGTVTEPSGKPVESANISLKDAEGRILTFTRTGKKGEYVLNLDENHLGIILEVSSIGFKNAVSKLGDPGRLYNFILQPGEVMLKEVTIKYRPKLTVVGDTLNYRTADFADEQDRSIGDVIRKMPGMEVSEDGTIKYNGKGISSFYIDGDNLLDDKYNIGSRTIPHGAVTTVQVIQNDQPIKMLRKNNTSENVALNLVISNAAKLKIMGEATTGLGTPYRFDGDITAILLQKKLKFINYIKGNNIGSDPGTDLISHNSGSSAGGYLSAGAAGVPSLPQNRYLFNKAGLINTNNLYNLTKDWQLKSNISYLYDERSQQYNKLSETYLPGETIRYTETQNNMVNPQSFATQLNLIDNAENHYLNNRLVINYAPLTTHSAIITNAVPANQLLKQTPLELSDVFNYMWQFRSGRNINLFSSIKRANQPEALTITPGLNDALLNNGTAYAGLNQYVELPSWISSTYTTMSFNKNKFTQNYTAGFDLLEQQLNSELYREQNNHTIELVSPTMVNDLDWIRTKAYINGSYSYDNKRRLRLNLSLPLSYNNISYQDASRVLNKNLQRVFVDPSLSITYQTGTESSVSAQYSLGNTLGSINDVYQGAILKNYRSLSANNAPVSEIKSQSIGGSFTTRKSTKMVFFNTSVSYSDQSFNTISSSTISNNIQQRVALPFANHMKSLNLGANASKYLFNLRTTVSGGVSFSRGRSEQLQNNKLFPYINQSMAYKAGISGKLFNFLTWYYDMTYAKSLSKASAANTAQSNFNQLRQQTTLSFKTLKNVYVNITGQHLLTEQSAQPDLKYLFADMNVNYRIKKLRTDIIFGATNLANIKTFEAVSIYSNSFTSGSYNIPGRVVMLKGKFSF